MRQWPRASVLGRHRRDEQQRRWLAVWVAFVILWVVGSALAADSSSKDEKDRSGEFSVPRDIRRPQNYGMSTLADYPRLLAEDDDEEEGQIMTPPKEQQMPLEVPTIQLADILPSTGFLVVRDKVTGSILSNSTTFFVAPDLVVTAAHSVAPLIRRFAVNLQVITNSRSSGGSRTFNVTALAYDATNAPCQIVLQVRHFPTSQRTLFLTPKRSFPPLLLSNLFYIFYCSFVGKWQPHTYSTALETSRRRRFHGSRRFQLSYRLWRHTLGWYASY